MRRAPRERRSVGDARCRCAVRTLGDPHCTSLSGHVASVTWKAGRRSHPPLRGGTSRVLNQRPTYATDVPRRTRRRVLPGPERVGVTGVTGAQLLRRAREPIRADTHAAGAARGAPRGDRGAHHVSELVHVAGSRHLHPHAKPPRRDIPLRLVWSAGRRMVS